MSVLTRLDWATLYVGAVFIIVGGSMVAYDQFDKRRDTREMEANLMAVSKDPSSQDSYWAEDTSTSMIEPTTESENTAGRKVAMASIGSIISFASTGGEFPRQPDTYQLAVDNFRTKRLQFENCVASLPSMSAAFTGGSEILIEGKSYDPQRIRIGSQSILLMGYDFAMVRLPRVAEHQTLLVDCEMNDTTQYNVLKLEVYP